MAIRIEIEKNYNNLLDLRIGDLTGSTEHSNISKEEVLSYIADEIDELSDKKEIPKENNCLNCKQSFRNDKSILSCKLNHMTFVSKGRECFVEESEPK